MSGSRYYIRGYDADYMLVAEVMAGTKQRQAEKNMDLILYGLIGNIPDNVRTIELIKDGSFMPIRSVGREPIARKSES